MLLEGKTTWLITKIDSCFSLYLKRVVLFLRLSAVMCDLLVSIQDGFCQV